MWQNIMYILYYFLTYIFFFFLKSLSISETNVAFVDDLAFQWFVNLQVLYVEMANLRVAPSLQSVKSHLTFLSLAYNSITNLHEQYFEGCDRLQGICLDYNNIHSMPDLSDVRHTLTSLFIGSNQVVDCGSLCVEFFAVLDHISVERNNITHMDIGKNLRLWPNVTKIVAHNNQMTSLPDLDEHDESSEYENATQVWLDAEENPYHCDQSMAWLAHSWDDIDNDAVVFGRVKIWTGVLDGMRCQTPDHMKGFPIWQLGKTVCFITFQYSTSLQIKGRLRLY